MVESVVVVAVLVSAVVVGVVGSVVASASAVGEERALETARYEREHPGSAYVWHAIDEASGAIVPPPKGQ